MRPPARKTRCSPFARVAALAMTAACGSAAPGAPDAVDPPDAAGGPDAGVDAAPAVFTPVPFDGEYDAHSVLWNRCDHAMHIAGSEPMEPGRYPVAIFLVGTSGIHDGPGVLDHVLPALARQGFVAASLDYENATLFGAAQNCNLYRDNAACMIRNDADYVDGERHSAIAQLCSRPKADCGKGVVFLGHSQGGLTAVQAFHVDPATPPAGAPVPRLIGAAPMGVGVAGYLAGLRVIDLDACMAAATLALDPSHLFIVNGEHDRYFNGPDADQAGGQAELEAVTGRTCAAPAWDCRGDGGDGYVLVKPDELSTGRAAHDYMSIPDGPFAEPDWIAPDNPAPWGLYSTARWMRAQAEP